MASQSLSITVGQTEFSVLEGTSAPGAGDIEVRFDLTKAPQAGTNQWVYDALMMFANHIVGKSIKAG
jgi:hypothetical protein